MNHAKTKSLMIVTTIAVFLALFFSPASGKTTPPQEGGVLPDIRLPAPKDQAQRNYLGLSGDGPFTIPQIKARAVIIEIFSMYCPYCQREAPEVNRLYSMIENNPTLKDKTLSFAYRNDYAHTPGITAPHLGHLPFTMLFLRIPSP